MATATTTRRVGSNAAPVQKASLDAVRTKGRGLPSRLILYGVEGVGKSSFAAFAPKPVFIQSRGETGLETLIDSGQIPETPYFGEAETFGDILALVRALIEDEHDYRTLALDTLNGIERLCHEQVCARDYGGDWTANGFLNFHKGYETAMGDWAQLLSLLDELRTKRRMAIIGLCHTKVAPFRNPQAADYDRYQPDLHKYTWSLTHRWADIVLFANFEDVVTEKDPKKKGKASGGQTRILYTQRHAAYDGKNRHGLPSEIEMGDSGADAWANFLKAMKGGAQ